jgi:hypothetical protein
MMMIIIIIIIIINTLWYVIGINVLQHLPLRILVFLMQQVGYDVLKDEQSHAVF